MYAVFHATILCDVAVICIMTCYDVDVESCVILFLCCTTGRGCWWILLFVCFYVALQAEVVGGFCCLFVRYWSFPPYFLLVLYIGTLRLSVQDMFSRKLLKTI